MSVNDSKPGKASLRVLTQAPELVASNPMLFQLKQRLFAGLAGVLVSTNRILTKALLKDERLNTIIFFALSIGSLFACFVVFHISRRSNFVKFYVTLCKGEAESREDKRKRLTARPSYTEDVSLVRVDSWTFVQLIVVKLRQTCTSTDRQANARTDLTSR